MTNNDLLKLSEFFDEAINLGDFTPEQLQQMLENYKTSNQKFKEKYFEYHDDIKHYSLKKQDW